MVSKLSYTIALGLVKGGNTFQGRVTIYYTLSKIRQDYVEGRDNRNCLFIDYKGKKINSIRFNTQYVDLNANNIEKNDKIYIPAAHQKVGSNKAEIEFESFYVKNHRGFHHFEDTANNGDEYVFTKLEPNFAHTCFPCFDQPDLKASHKTLILAPMG